MSIESIMQRVEHTIDGSFRKVFGTLVILVPLIVAAVFATVAASIFANEHLGPVLGNLAIAGGFFVIFLICLFVVQGRSSHFEEEQASVLSRNEKPQIEAPSISFASLIDPSRMSSIEREIFNSFISRVPDAAKSLLQQAPRNLHLLAGASIGLIVASRVAKMIERRG